MITNLGCILLNNDYVFNDLFYYCRRKPIQHNEENMRLIDSIIKNQQCGEYFIPLL